jgi:hypothetical protein
MEVLHNKLAQYILVKWNKLHKTFEFASGSSLNNLEEGTISRRTLNMMNYEPETFARNVQDVPWLSSPLIWGCGPFFD